MIKSKKNYSFSGTRLLITRDEAELTSVKSNAWGSKFNFFLDDHEYELKKNNFWGTEYSCRRDGEDLLIASQIFGFCSKWEIEYQGKVFKWESQGWFSNAYNLKIDGSPHVIGSATKPSMWKSIWQLDLPPKIDPWFQVILLTLVQINENSAAAAATSGS